MGYVERLYTEVEQHVSSDEDRGDMISKGLKRLAAALRRQDPVYALEQARRCDLYTYDSTGAIVGACALGKIALEFFGTEQMWERMREETESEACIRDMFQEAGLPQKMKVLHPLTQERWDLTDAMINLNDEEQWTFAGIATWLEREADRIILAQRSLTQTTLW